MRHLPESHSASDKTAPELELSIVMPCLNEAETLAVCIRKAQNYLNRSHIKGEVIVADNGSNDGSQAIATRLNARLVHVAEKGYGTALMGGIQAARSRYVIMADADDSYDFSQLDGFVDKLREGYDLVMGNRFQGGIRPGAMPWLHRYLGNPVLSGIGRLFFKSPVGDFHCGLRGFSRQAILGLHLRSTGMEFASEMVVKATLNGLKITEVPTTLSPDGRSRPPHLRRWRDGWRHLRFLLIYSPRWLFLYPGLGLLLLGLAVMAWLLPGPRNLGSITFDIHTLLYAAMSVLLGLQAVGFALFATYYGIQQGLLPPQDRFSHLLSRLTLERGLVLGIVLVLVGLAGTLWAVFGWRAADFGPLSPSTTMRLAIPSVTALTAGFQVLFMSFFLGLLYQRSSTH